VYPHRTHQWGFTQLGLLERQRRLIGWGYAQMQRKLTEWAAENLELAGNMKTK